MTGILHGKVIIICIARLDPPLKRRDCGEHPFNFQIAALATTPLIYIKYLDIIYEWATCINL